MLLGLLGLGMVASTGFMSVEMGWNWQVLNKQSMWGLGVGAAAVAASSVEEIVCVCGTQFNAEGRSAENMMRAVSRVGAHLQQVQ